MNIAELMTLAEASGFSGGSANFVDEYPELGLTECVNALPMFILESQIEGFEATRRHNDAMVECAISQMRNGVMDESAITELNEKGLDNVKAAVKNFFARIKKFIDSIIAKLKVMIDKLRLSGKQLWQKYGNDPDLKNTEKLKGLTFDGYRFPDDPFPYAAKFDDADGPRRLLKEAYGTDAINPSSADLQKAFKDAQVYQEEIKSTTITKNASGTDTREKVEQEEKRYKKGSDEHLAAIDKIIEKLGEQTSAERTTKMVAALTGMDGLDNDWREGVRKKLWGEKFTFTYGKDGFDVSTVGTILSNPADLDKIRQQYENVRKGVESYEKELNSNIEKVKGTDAVSGKITSYMSKYLEATKDAYAAINGVKAIHTDYARKRNEQAKKMFGMMLSAAKRGEKKSDNNDVEIDDELLFEI